MKSDQPGNESKSSLQVPVRSAMDSTSSLPSSGAASVEEPLTGIQVDQVDDLGDQLMALHSVDGRPPSTRERYEGWKWLFILGPVFAGAGITLSLLLGARTAEVFVGVLLLLGFLLIGSWPVWGAGLLRGKEERLAKTEATEELRHPTFGSRGSSR